MKSIFKSFITVSVLALVGCSSQEIPPAHKGRMLDRTGPLAFYAGGKGFEGPILGAGTHYTGVYNEVRVVECVEQTEKEELTALTKDGVQFKLDFYTGYSINCDDDKAVSTVLDKLAPGFHDPAHPDWDRTVFAKQLYNTYIRPALGEAVRESISPYIANEINAKREELFGKVKKNFDDAIGKQNPRLIVVRTMNLSNLDFPDELDKANAERAVQSVLKDKAIAEQDKVKAEIDTATMKKKLAEAEANNDVARIDAIGAAYRRNPEYATIEALHYAGEKGNMILLPTNTNTVVQLPAKK